MRAALRLRLLEARRRGGWLLLAIGVVVVGAVALRGGDTPDGRYGLATDLAAAFAYGAALFFGAFPLAIDREKKRSYLPGASPVRPWSWALGNALGAAAVAGAAGLLLFAAAGLGATLGGGIETHLAHPFIGRGTHYLPLRLTRMPSDVTKLRIVPRVYISAEEKVGTTDFATVEVNGERYEFYPGQPLVVAISGPTALLENLSEDHVVGIDASHTRALGKPRPFLANALGAAVAPALGAAALAAFGAMAAANLSAPVAALLVALALVLCSLKGFLLDTFEYEGRTRREMEAGGKDASGDGHGHDHGAAETGAVRAAARGIVRGILVALPDLSGLDRTDRVATGEWTGLEESGSALAILAVALALATGLGGAGVHLRRLP